MKQVLLTFILTSLLWFSFFEWSRRIEERSSQAEATEEVCEELPSEVVSNDTPTPADTPKPAPATKKSTRATPFKKRPTTPTTQAAERPSTAVVADIAGLWSPVEGAEFPLEFTPYGTMIQQMYGVPFRKEYSVQGNRIKISYELAEFKLLNEKGATYLEIYKSKDYSGRYVRKALPKQVAATPLAKSQYAETAVGKWSPIDGQKHPLELTKFNTAIQNMHGVNMRYDYTLNEEMLSIGYDKNAHIVLSEDNSYYYMEIHNTEDFSGLYRRTK